MNTWQRQITMATVLGMIAFGPSSGQDVKTSPKPEQKTTVEKAEASPPKTMSVLRLKHVQSNEAVNVISGLFQRSPDQLRVVGDVRTNSIIIWATEADTQTVKALLTNLDVDQAENQKNRWQFHTIQLKNSPDDVLSNGLKVLLEGNVIRYSVDPVRKQIVISGQSSAIDLVERFVKTWDVALPKPATAIPSNIQIRVLWMHNWNGEPQQQPALPDDLKALIGPLRKVGIEHPAVGGRYMVTASPGVEFTTNGVMPGKKNSLRITGRYDADRKPAPVLRLELRDVRLDNTPNLVDLSTQVTAPLGRLIILGATEVHGPMAFVVEVTELGKE